MKNLSTKNEIYIPCTEVSLPAGLRFHTPQRNQGQIEVSYASPGRRDEACAGDEYRCTIDRSTGLTTYARRSDVKATWGGGGAW